MANSLPCVRAYADPRRYDLENLGWTKDIRFYLRQVRRLGGPVLELGCGTGRIALALARAGLEVTGLEISPGMLSLARAKARRAGLPIRWVLGDMRRLALGREFKAILLPFNGIQHLREDRSLKALLRGVWSHLAPGGRFLMDVDNPRLDRLLESRPRVIARYRDRNRWVRVTEAHAYDPGSRINRVTWRHQAHNEAVYLERSRLRVFFPEELDDVLRRAGFEVLSRLGDFAGRPFRKDSTYQILICASRDLS